MLARIKKMQAEFEYDGKRLKNDKPGSPIESISYEQSIYTNIDGIQAINAYVQIEFHWEFKNHAKRQEIQEMLLLKFKECCMMRMESCLPLDTMDFLGVAQLLYPAYLSDKFMQQLYGEPKSLKETCVGFIEKAYQAKVGFWSTNKENIAKLNNDIASNFSTALRKEVGFEDKPLTVPTLQADKNAPELPERSRFSL